MTQRFLFEVGVAESRATMHDCQNLRYVVADEREQVREKLDSYEKPVMRVFCCGELCQNCSQLSDVSDDYDLLCGTCRDMIADS